MRLTLTLTAALDLAFAGMHVEVDMYDTSCYFGRRRTAVEDRSGDPIESLFDVGFFV